MTGSQRHGLVEEEQWRVPIGFPLRHPAAPERQHTRDPDLVLMVAKNVALTAALVQTPAVAHPGATTRHGNDLSER
ncbi:hypothetical protein [Mycobacterium montefiorense]|uniref:hypothetical protein n=1 Tax=Mycobacterium montefiorense TaxID=154654 RepID=UPI00222FF037|nr:hypothetical protein [Mycobacterium montefiorense]